LIKKDMITSYLIKSLGFLRVPSVMAKNVTGPIYEMAFRRGAIPLSCASLSLWERVGARGKGAPALAGNWRSGAHASIVALVGSGSWEVVISL
jgi:hypothetical protein